jgi:hypothetical protein
LRPLPALAKARTSSFRSRAMEAIYTVILFLVGFAALNYLNEKRID